MYLQGVSVYVFVSKLGFIQNKWRWNFCHLFHFIFVVCPYHCAHTSFTWTWTCVSLVFGDTVLLELKSINNHKIHLCEQNKPIAQKGKQNTFRFDFDMLRYYSYFPITSTNPALTQRKGGKSTPAKRALPVCFRFPKKYHLILIEFHLESKRRISKSLASYVCRTVRLKHFELSGVALLFGVCLASERAGKRASWREGTFAAFHNSAKSWKSLSLRNDTIHVPVFFIRFSLHYPLEEFRCIDSNEILVVFSPSFTDALTCVHLRKQRNFFLWVSVCVCVYVFLVYRVGRITGCVREENCLSKMEYTLRIYFPVSTFFVRLSPEQPIIVLRNKVRSIANSEENEKPNTEVEAMARQPYGGGERMVHMALGNDDVYVWNIYLKHSLSPSESSLWSWQP